MSRVVLPVLAGVSVLGVGVGVASAATPTADDPYPMSLVSSRADGTVGHTPDYLFAPTLAGASADGRFVLFFSQATDLPGSYPAGGSAGLYLKDLTTGALSTISAFHGQPFAVNVNAAAISADGSTVAFVAAPTSVGLTGATTNTNLSDVIVEKLATGTYTRASHVGVGYDSIDSVSLSGNGDGVAFSTYFYSNELASAAEGVGVRSVSAASEVDAVTSVSTAADDALVPANPVLSRDGSHVAFSAGSGGTPGIPSNSVDVADFATGTIVAAGRPPLTPPGGFLQQQAQSDLAPQLNDDGSIVVIASNEGSAILIKNLRTGETTTLPEAEAIGSGADALTGFVQLARLSPDGQRLLYELGPVGSAANGDPVYRFEAYDLATGAHWIVGGDYSRSSNLALAGPGDNQIFYLTADSFDPKDDNAGADVYRISVG